jgi:hypothetical protein
VVHVELSDLVLNKARSHHGEVAIFVHLADVTQRFGGAAREGRPPTAPWVSGLPEMHKMDEACLKDRFSMVIRLR